MRFSSSREGEKEPAAATTKEIKETSNNFSNDDTD